MSWILTGAVFLETVLLDTQNIVKMDGFESFSNIIHIVWSLWYLKFKWLHWNFCPVCQIEGILFTNGKMSWMLTGAVYLETVILGTQDKFC